MLRGKSPAGNASKRGSKLRPLISFDFCEDNFKRQERGRAKMHTAKGYVSIYLVSSKVHAGWQTISYFIEGKRETWKQQAWYDKEGEE